MSDVFSLDRARRLLFRGEQVFDPGARYWAAVTEPTTAEPIALREAVRWLQHESGNPCRAPIGVVGPREASAEARQTAFMVGVGLASLGLVLLCGGKGGVMEAACEGAASAGGISIGLLPDADWDAANRFVTIPIATGIGEARNALVARAALVLIAIGGSYGTLSEIALGLQFGRPVLSLLDTPALPGARPMGSADAVLDSVCRLVLGLPG